MSSEVLHAPREVLSLEARLLHNAIASLMEELEAVDWYRQRADDTEDEALREILLHNMREEMEHASMVLEWIRRRDAVFDAKLREFLFTEGPIVGREQAIERAESGAAAAPANGGAAASLGSLRGGR